MAFFDKLSDIAKNIGDKTSDALETSKLNSKISGEKSAITECMRKIGEYINQQRLENGFTDDNLTELFAEIDAHNAAIAEAQAGIEAIKVAAAAPTPVQTQAASVPIADANPDAVVCSACGQNNPSGTKFCGGCGGKLEPPAPPAPIAALDRICPGCGGMVPLDSRFCGECGHRFDQQ